MGAPRPARLGLSALDRSAALGTQPSYHRPSRATLSGVTRIALALIAVLVLAGCSSAPAATPVASATPSNQAAFLTLLDGIWPGIDNATWIEIGHGICESLDAGQTPDQVAATMLAEGAPTNEAGTRVLLRASVVTYCPTHEDVVPAQQ